jgi:hypothetical protein
MLKRYEGLGMCEHLKGLEWRGHSARCYITTISAFHIQCGNMQLVGLQIRFNFKLPLATFDSLKLSVFTMCFQQWATFAFELSMPKLGYKSEFICEESTPNWG